MALLLACVSVLLVGCSGKSVATNFEPIETATDDGSVTITSESNRFNVTVYPAVVELDQQQRYVKYRVVIVNKSRYGYKNFFPTLIFNKELDQYFAAGIAPLPITPVDLGSPEVPDESGNTALGMDVTFSQLVNTEEFFAETDKRSRDILKLTSGFAVELHWDGGEERISFDIQVTDPNGLLN